MAEEWITLTLPEVLNGCIVGGLRHMESVGANRKDKHGFDPKERSGLARHIEGACGEIAVAKLKDRYYSGALNSFKGADVGRDWQVKTRIDRSWDLLVRDDDHDDHIFILVTGAAPTYCIRGWMYGWEAKQPEFLRDYGGRPEAWFVPQGRLRSLQRKALRNE